MASHSGIRRVWKHEQHQVRSRRHHDQLVAFARQSITNKESADAYEHTYETMEAGLFQLVGRTLRCDPHCELCAAIRVEEQVSQSASDARRTGTTEED